MKFKPGDIVRLNPSWIARQNELRGPLNWYAQRANYRFEVECAFNDYQYRVQRIGAPNERTHINGYYFSDEELDFARYTLEYAIRRLEELL